MSVDFYDIDSLLTEEERMVRDNVRAFVDARVLPGISKHYEEGTFPSDLIPEFGKLGVLGATLPEAYGCAGMGDVAYGLVMQELERCDSGIRSFCSVQGALVMYPIYAFGSEEHRTTWLPKLASGEAVGCFGLTEPDFGSNPGGMITRAERTANGFKLNGTKRWITNGNLADVAIVWAKLDGVIRGFVVPTNTPGFTALKIERKFSLRASVTSELILEDVEVPESALMPGVEGIKGPLSVPHAGPLRHRLGRHRRGGSLLRVRGRLREDEGPVLTPHRGLPARAGEVRRHAHRDHQGTTRRLATRQAEGGEEDEARPGLARQAQQRLHGARDRA